MLSLEASLRISQSRLPEATALLDKALEVDSGSQRLKLLVKRARLLEWAGDYEGSLEALRRVSFLVSTEDDPRLHWMLQLDSALNLCHLGRYAEAEVMLPEIKSLTAQLDNKLDALRLLWLEGRISAGLGKSERSIVALARLRAEFIARGIGYDAALATLELAVLLLGKGAGTREVKKLAREMAPISTRRESTARLWLRSSCSVKLLKRNWRPWSWPVEWWSIFIGLGIIHRSGLSRSP